MFKVSVYVTPKSGISDPQGATVERALPALGFEGVEQVRVGRFITLEVDGAEEEVVRRDVDDMCRRLLANPIIEDYHFELTASGPGAAGEHASSPWTAADPFAHRESESEE